MKLSTIVPVYETIFYGKYQVNWLTEEFLGDFRI